MQGNWSAFVDELKRDRSWRVLAGSVVGYGLGVTVLPFYTLGAFVVPLERDFGWSRAQIQGSLAYLTLATLMVGWAYGALTDRHGTRLVAAASQLGLAISLMLLALSPGNIWIWHGLWLLMSLVGLGTSPVTWTRGISGWFDAGRGMALAIAMTGAGACALIAPVSVSLLIDAAGWRASYVVLGAIVLAIGLPVTLFLYPREGIRPGVALRRAAAPLVGMTAAEALRGFRFWAILASVMLVGFAITGLIPNIVPMLIGRGMRATAATGYMGVLGVSVIGGRIIGGLALDRLWGPLVACIFLPLPAIGCMIFAFGPLDPLAIGLAVALLGFATGAEFDLVPYLCTRYFGLAHYGRIYSLQWIGFTAAGGIAPALFGLSYDLVGSYVPILTASGLIVLIAPLVLLPLGKYPRWEDAAPDGKLANPAISTLSPPPVSA